MTDSLRTQLRLYLSFIHIQSAARHSRSCWQVEQQFAGTANEELNQQTLALAIAALYSSASFLEAQINELFRDVAAFRNDERFAALTEVQRNGLADYSRTNSYSSFKAAKTQAYRKAGTFGNEILNKIQFAASTVTGHELSETTNLWSDVRDLINARNSITHFEPETVTIFDSDAPVPVQEMTTRLDGKFAVNPFAQTAGHLIFPELHLGHGGAEWSVQTAIEFADAFWTHIKLPPPYDHIRSQLTTK